jgi:molecular chaperone Hsp33
LKSSKFIQENIEDDIITPFSLGGGNIRGRIFKSRNVVNKILSQHEYPEKVNIILGETIALGSMLGSALKFNGKFTCQLNSDGPINLLIVDFKTPGSIRAYAHFNKEKITNNISQLLGNGHMAMTIDQGPEMEKYQGITQLKDGDLVSSAYSYFQDSEQIPTKLFLSCGKIKYYGQREKWISGGIILQRMPNKNNQTIKDDDLWNTTNHLLDTVTYDELIDPSLSAESLLYRLFNEYNTIVYNPITLKHACQCSKSKIKSLLKSFIKEDIEDIIIDGNVIIKCEFCGKDYKIKH